MTYFVIAKHWDEEKKEQVNYIAGQFEEYRNATLFKEAYNEWYHADAVIRDEHTILTARV